MKKIIYLVLIACGIAMLPSCSKDSDDTSKVTYFVDLELKGDNVVFCAKGSSFVEPGFSAFENGEDITSKVEVTAVNTTKTGIYKVNYSVKNSDGIPNIASRSVVVFDPTSSVMESAVYKVDPDSYRVAAATTKYGKSFDIIIYQVTPGVFGITDFLGGWYDQRAGYGSAYAAVGTFQLNADNTISLLTSSVAGWGDSLSSIAEAKYDSAEEIITWEVGYAGMTFVQTLTK